MDVADSSAAVSVTKERLDAFRRAVHGKFQTSHAQSLSVQEVSLPSAHLRLQISI